MKKVFKVVSTLLVLSMLLCSFVFTANAAVTKYTDGDYKYTVTDNKAKIVEFNKKFEGDVEIPSTLGGYEVTSIAADAFFCCHGVKSITVPSGIVDIAPTSFYAMEKLAAIIVDAANPNYSSQDGVFFDKDKKTLLQYPFAKICETYTAPNGVETIGTNAFYQTPYVNAVILPDSVQAIEDTAFRLCSMKSISIGSGLKTLGATVFQEASRLESISFAGGPEIIPTDTFTDCIALKNVTLGEGLKSIKTGAFAYCEALETINIPASATSVDAEAFTGCINLSSITVDGSNTKYSSNDGILCSKSGKTIYRYPLGKQGDSFTLPTAVTTIGTYAFYGCQNLKTITFNNKLKTINTYAFMNCTNLESISLPSTVETIGNYAFMNCAKLKSATVNGTATALGTSAFAECRNLESITLPDSIKAIGNTAFLNCSSLATAPIGDNAESIGKRAFYGCASLEDIYIPASVLTISNEAFANCNGISEFTVSDDNTAFSSADGVLFDKSGEKLIQYPIASENTSYTVPNTVKEVGISSFDGNAYLESVTFGNNVQIIAADAFKTSPQLKEITLPQSLTSVGDSACFQCVKLADVYYGGTEDDWKLVAIGTKNTPLTNAAKNIHTSDIPLCMNEVQSIKTDTEGNFATMRFFFKPEYYGAVAESFGAYVIPLDLFIGSEAPTAIVKKNEPIESGTTYSVDLVDIPKAAFDDDIFAIPFVMSGGSALMLIEPDTYVGNSVNNTDINQNTIQD